VCASAPPHLFIYQRVSAIHTYLPTSFSSVASCVRFLTSGLLEVTKRMAPSDRYSLADAEALMLHGRTAIVDHVLLFRLVYGYKQAVRHAAPIWPLQDILIGSFCARIIYPCVLPAHLHCPHCCSTIVRLLGNIRPPLDLPCVRHTPYTIGNNNIV